MAMWEIVEQGQTLRRARRPFALATVVRRERPASAHPGDQAIITAEGQLRGWIGGSCAEPIVIREALRALQDGNSCLVRLGPPDSVPGVTSEGMAVYPMTCHSGGTLEIFVDPCLPEPQVILAGQSPITEALAGLAEAAGFEVVVCAPGAGEDPFPTARQVLPSLDPSRVTLDGRTYVVVATHGQMDEESLKAALQSQAAYVALVASRRRARVCKENLLAMGLSAEQVGRLKAPAGLDLGAITSGEIAVSILAEMVQHRRAATPSGRVDARQPAEQEGNSAAPATVVDPVCGMIVEPSDGTPSAGYHGMTYYFCCPACRRQFERDPARFLAAGGRTGVAVGGTS